MRPDIRSRPFVRMLSSEKIPPVTLGVGEHRLDFVADVVLPVDPDEPAQPATTFDDGTYRVGIDIEPGLYVVEPQDDCYWARLSDFQHAGSSTVGNGLPDAGERAKVRIMATDVELHQPQVWHVGTRRVAVSRGLRASAS